MVNVKEYIKYKLFSYTPLILEVFILRVLIVFSLFSFNINIANSISLTEQPSFKSSALSNDQLVFGKVLQVESIHQLCSSIGITKYTIEVTNSSQTSLIETNLEVVIFGGESINGDLVYINKNYRFNVNDQIRLFVNNLDSNVSYVHDYINGINKLSNTIKSSYQMDDRQLQITINERILDFKEIKSNAKNTVVDKNLKKYYQDALNGTIECSGSPSIIQSSNSSKDFEYYSDKYKKSSKSEIKSSEIYPGYTDRNYVTGPASGTSNFDTLTNSAYEAWNFRNNDSLVQVVSGNNTWQFGGVVPRNEWAGWPDNNSLASQGLPPWKSNVLGVAFSALRSGGQIKETDIVLNPDFTWTWVNWSASSLFNNAYSVHNTLGHELGHLLNLDHPWEVYDVDHHSIMNYPPKSCRRNHIGIDDYSYFAGSSSIINPPLTLHDYRNTVYPCTAENADGNEPKYRSLRITPNVFECDQFNCLGEELNGNISGFTKQNFGTLATSSDLYFAFSYHPHSPIPQLNDGNLSIINYLDIPDLESLESYKVTNPINTNFRVPSYNYFVPNNFETLWNYGIQKTGGLLWPSVAGAEPYRATFVINPIYIRGSDLNNDINGGTLFTRGQSPKDFYIPIGGGFKFIADPFFDGPIEPYFIEIIAPSNSELTIREELGFYSNTYREFRVCGGTESDLIRIEMSYSNPNNKSVFKIYYDDFDQIDLLNNSVEVPLGTLKYVEGILPNDINSFTSLEKYQDTIFKNSFNVTRNNECELISDNRHTYTMIGLGRPFGVF